MVPFLYDSRMHYAYCGPCVQNVLCNLVLRVFVASQDSAV